MLPYGNLSLYKKGAPCGAQLQVQKEAPLLVESTLQRP
jgi:hypothetical protein